MQVLAIAQQAYVNAMMDILAPHANEQNAQMSAAAMAFA